MAIEVSPLTLVATLGIALLGPTLAVLFDTRWRGAGIRSAAVRALGVSAVSWVTWVGTVALWRPEIDPLLMLPITGLAGLAATLASAVPRLLDYPTRVTLVFAAVWVPSVFAPVAIALFSMTDGILGAGLATLDLAGALPVLVASGCTGLAVLVLERSRQRANTPSPTSTGIIAGAFFTAWLLWILFLVGLWLVGLELAIDEFTGRIILNAVISPIASALSWLVVQQIRHARTTPVAIVGGVLCGLVAIAPGCGYLDPVGATLTGVIAGAVCSLTGYALVRRTAQPAWLLVSVLILAASTGVVLLGVFATRSGLMFTGQPEVLVSQFASVLLVAVYSGVVSAVVWLVVRALAARSRRTRSRNELRLPIDHPGKSQPD